VALHDFTYETSPASGRSLLHSVKRCGYLGGCTWAKVLSWNTPAGPQFTPYTVPGQHPANVFVSMQLPLLSPLTLWVPPSTVVFDADGDGDGDGLDDVVYYAGDTGTGQNPVAQMIQGSRTAAGPQMLASTYSAANANSPFESRYTPVMRPVDLDGDGTTELWFGGSGAINCTQKALHWTQTPSGPLFTALALGITEGARSSLPWTVATVCDGATRFRRITGAKDWPS
jgi:hypothetical protein